MLLTADRCAPGRRHEGFCLLETVSIYELLARPERWHGRRVRVHGVVRIDGGESAIYPTEAEARHAAYEAGLWLDVSAEQREQGAALSNRFCVVEGDFDARGRGDPRVWSGAIEKISRLEAAPSR